LETQSRKFKPKFVSISQKFYQDLKIRLADTDTKVLCGEEGIDEISCQKVDILLNSLVGVAGLKPTLTAIKAGNDIALANKETLVAGGNLVMSLAKEKNVKILPVDSEHSAIFQCLQGQLQGNDISKIRKIILTASGGAFFGKTKKELEKVTLKDALKHPNWDMGAKVTIDSSTLMNKGLEFIEAMRLFSVKTSQIEVVIHPQSVVHSAVEYVDGSIISQMGVPDMRLPIQYALLYPNRMESPVKSLDLAEYGELTFFKPDFETFGCLSACIKAAEMGDTYTCAVNFANEIAIKRFIKGEITYLQIPEIVNSVLDFKFYKNIKTYEDVVNINNYITENV
jgi:1-deoxy-D-xylulose-5-phosphate reductoisomerase